MPPYPNPMADPRMAAAMAYPAPNRRQPRSRKGGKRSKLLIGGIFACAIGILLLIGTLLVLYFDPFGMNKGSNIAPPDAAQAESAFKSASVDPPDLNGYRYVDPNGLTGPEIDRVTIGSVTQQGSSTPTCDATAVAVFQNDSVKAEIPLSLRMDYSESSGTWSAGSVTQSSSSPTVTPVAAPDAAALEEDFFALFTAYDKQIADQFQDCTITPDAKLSSGGGTIAYHLSKSVEGSDAPLECTVNESVKWNSSEGWDPAIDSIDGLDGAGNVEPEQPDTQPPAEDQTSSPESGGQSGGGGGSGGSSGSSGSSGPTPTKLLVCYTGELVEIPGTVQFSSNKILIRADDMIRVILDGREYITQYFELIPAEGSLTAGEHKYFIGEISRSNSSDTPLVINENWDW